MSARFAAQIMLIRHGEKPPGDPPPHGVSAHGERDMESLTVRGWQRAGALASLFAPATGKDARHGLSVPRQLYACNPHKHSKRTRQTLTPLARKLGIEINEDFSAGDEAELARHARERHGAVLICWRHHHLHTLAHHRSSSRQPELPSLPSALSIPGAANAGADPNRTANGKRRLPQRLQRNGNCRRGLQLHCLWKGFRR